MREAEREGGEQRQGAAIGHPHRTNDGLPARAEGVIEKARAGEQMHASVIHDAQVARVVHMQVEVDVLRPHVHADVIFLEHVQASKRPEGLADGQGGNADEADEVRQGKILDLSLRGAGEGAGAKAPRLLRGFHAALRGAGFFWDGFPGLRCALPGLFSVLTPGRWRAGVGLVSSATIASTMRNLSRRDFMKTAAAATIATSARGFGAVNHQRVLVGSNSDNGILAYDWNGATGELKPAGVAAKIPMVDWLVYSPKEDFLYAACEVDSFNGKATGEVASFSVNDGALQQISAQNSAAKGTCHVGLDRTGRVLLSADYGGGSAASFLITDGKLSEVVWTEPYTEPGPDKDRQEAAHAHFCTLSPDNRCA